MAEPAPNTQAAFTIPETALKLGKSDKQVRTMVEQGAPVVFRGRRGRGLATLLDPEALRAWEHERNENSRNLVLQLAADIPALAERAIYESFRMCEGPHKIACAGLLAATWISIVGELLDRCRVDAPGVPDVKHLHLPEKILLIKSIFDRFG